MPVILKLEMNLSLRVDGIRKRNPGGATGVPGKSIERPMSAESAFHYWIALCLYFRFHISNYSFNGLPFYLGVAIYCYEVQYARSIRTHFSTLLQPFA